MLASFRRVKMQYLEFLTPSGARQNFASRARWRHAAARKQVAKSTLTTGMPDLLAEVACGGVSTAAVSAALNPVDVIKTRRQLERFSERRALEIAQSLWAEGGAAALWRPGLAATIAREIVYSGCTKGLYPVVRDAISGDADPTLPQRVAAASATGFGGSICANALDIVKVRQFDQPRRYPSLPAALRQIATEEGLLSGLLLRGVSASAPRGAAIAVGEVTTYDQAKSWLKQHYADGFGMHVTCSLITGVVATTVAAPFDLLKSRVLARADTYVPGPPHCTWGRRVAASCVLYVPKAQDSLPRRGDYCTYAVNARASRGVCRTYRVPPYRVPWHYRSWPAPTPPTLSPACCCGCCGKKGPWRSSTAGCPPTCASARTPYSPSRCSRRCEAPPASRTFDARVSVCRAIYRSIYLSIYLSIPSSTVPWCRGAGEWFRS